MAENENPVSGALHCPTCGQENPAEAKRCMNCGRQFGAQCPICLTINDPNAEACSFCGGALDRLETVLVRQEITGIQKEWLIASKAEDAVFMRRERAKLDQEEIERQQRLSAQHVNAKKEQERILMIALIVCGACALIGLGATLIISILR